MGTQELIIAGVVLAVLVFAPLLFAFARAGFRHPLLAAILVSIAVFLVVALVAGFTGVNALAILAILAIAAIVYGLLAPNALSTQQKETVGHDAVPMSFHPESETSEVDRDERPTAPTLLSTHSDSNSSDAELKSLRRRNEELKRKVEATKLAEKQANDRAALDAENARLMQQLGEGIVSSQRSSHVHPSSGANRNLADRKISGVGGWLALLVVGMLVWGPLLSIFKTGYNIWVAEMQNPELASVPQWQTFKIMTWCVVGICVVYSMVSGFLLCVKKEPASVKIAIACLWIGNPVAAFVLGILIPWISFGTATLEKIVPESIGAIIVSIIAASIWTAYLRKSERVRNTYFLRSVIRTSDNKSEQSPKKPSSAESKDTERWKELPKDEIDGATERFGEQSNSLKPLGNLTYEEASRYFNEYCELLIQGCGIGEKESCLPTSFDRMKEALKVECLNWCNLGGDFDENWELIGTGVIRLSWFVPDEIAEKTRKSPDSSNLEELKAYLAASRAADEIIERRTNELNVEWNEFRRRYRTEQIPKSPSLPNRSQPQQHAPAVVSKSETKEVTKDHVSPSAPDALCTPQKETDGQDAMPVSFHPESETWDAELNERPSDSYKASTKQSETPSLSVFFAIVGFLMLLGGLFLGIITPRRTGEYQRDVNNGGSMELKAKNDMENAQKSDFLEIFEKVAAERDAERQLPPNEFGTDELDRRTGNAIASPIGRPGEIENFLRESINQMVALRNQYQVDLGQIGWDRILNPEHLAVDPRLARSKASIRKAKEIVDQYEEQVNSLLENMRNDINKLNMSAKEKAEAREAFERGTQESIQTRNQILQLEREIVRKCGEMIEYLYKDYGNWSVSDSQIHFSNNETATGYNRYVDAIEKLAAQLEQLRRYGEQKMQSGVDRHRLTFDCSTDEAYNRSYDSILAELSLIEQEKLKVAVFNLFLRAAGDLNPSHPAYEDISVQRFNKLIDGKNAAQVIEIAGERRPK